MDNPEGERELHAAAFPTYAILLTVGLGDLRLPRRQAALFLCGCYLHQGQLLRKTAGSECRGTAKHGYDHLEWG